MAHPFIITAPSWSFVLIPLVIMGIGGLLWYAKRLFAAVNVLAHPQHRALMAPSFSLIKCTFRIVFIATAVCAIAVALLRPQYTSDKPEERFEYRRDVVVAVDISRSMLVEDCNGMSRLTCARKKIIDVVSKLASDRVALIVFSGTALTLCPLTKDGVAFRMFLDSLDTEVLQGGMTTSLSSALRAACTLFQHSTEQKNKLVILVTDGEDFSSDFTAAQQEATQAGLQISVIGVGSKEGGPIPLYNEQGVREGHQRDQQGAIVISKPNESLLKSLIHRYNGLYVSLDPTGTHDIADMVTWVQAREREKGAVFLQEDRKDLFMFCSGWALCAVAIAWML